MSRSIVIAAMLVAFTLGTGTAGAEDAAPAASKMSTADKKAISKACSEQADAKGLHGKERKKFRSECKHHGGKAE